MKQLWQTDKINVQLAIGTTNIMFCLPFTRILFSIDKFVAQDCLRLKEGIQLKASDVYKLAAELMGLEGINWAFVLITKSRKEGEGGKRKKGTAREGVSELCMRACLYVYFSAIVLGCNWRQAWQGHS